MKNLNSKQIEATSKVMEGCAHWIVLLVLFGFAAGIFGMLFGCQPVEKAPCPECARFWEWLETPITSTLPAASNREGEG